MPLFEKPENKTNQIIIFLSGVFLAILGLIYLVNQVDLVPDNLGFIGYLDDLIVLILIIVLINRLIKRLSSRVSRNASAYKELWRSGDLFKIFSSGKTWFKIIILSGVFWYFFWTMDLIPDYVAGIGYVDDVIVAIGALFAILKFYSTKR